MKTSALILCIASLASGLAAGFWFEPDVSGSKSSPSSVVQRTALAESYASTGPAIASTSAADAREIPLRPDTFAALLVEPNTYLAAKNLLATIGHLPASDLPAAFRAVRSAPETNQKLGLEMLFGHWMEIDPAGALQALDDTRRLPSTDLSTQILSDVYREWAAQDPDGALDDARDCLTGSTRSAALKAVIGLAAEDDPAAAVATANELDHSHLGDHLTSIFGTWADRDPEAATQAVLALPAPQQAAALDGMANHLLQSDPNAAVAWLDQLPDEKTRALARNALAVNWTHADPDSAMRWAESLPPSARGTAEKTIVGEWTSTDAAGEIAYADKLPDGQEKKLILSSDALAQLSYNDAQASWAWAQKQAPADRKNATWTVANWWADYSPEAASAKVLTLAPGPERDAALSAVIGSWNFNVMPEAKSNAWIASLPAGKPRDDALASQSRTTSRSDPAKALEQSAAISDTAARQDTQAKVYEQWLRNDKAAGTAALQNSTLPTDVKERILRPQYSGLPNFWSTGE